RLGHDGAVPPQERLEHAHLLGGEIEEAHVHPRRIVLDVDDVAVHLDELAVGELHRHQHRVAHRQRRVGAEEDPALGQVLEVAQLELPPAHELDADAVHGSRSLSTSSSSSSYGPSYGSSPRSTISTSCESIASASSPLSSATRSTLPVVSSSTGGRSGRVPVRHPALTVTWNARPSK